MRPEHETEDTLNAWLDNELTSREKSLVSAHVEQCASCAAALVECREMRATVSVLLHSYDDTVESAPSRRGASRLKFEATKPSTSAPIISRIVESSQPINVWFSAKKMLPVAAAAALLVGSATVAIMRNYNVLTGSVNSVASTAQVPFVNVRGRVMRPEGRPIANATVWIDDRKSVAHTDGDGNFLLSNVPRETKNIHARSIGYSEAVVPLAPDNASEIIVTLVPNVLKLEPVRIRLDSMPAASGKR